MALLLAAGWWVLRAPLAEEPRAKGAEVDLDSPAMRELAASSVPMPDGRVELVKSPAASAPGQGTNSDRCGNEQRPGYTLMPMSEGPFLKPVMTKPAALNYAAAQARIDAALRSSPDAFDRAVADLLNVGDMRTPSGALEALVEDAGASVDARVYSLALIACRDAEARSGPPVDGPPPPASCASLNARRWAQLDPGNGVPWLAIFQEARQADDAAAQEDALAHLAASTRFEGRLHAAAGAVLRRASGNPEDGAATDDLATRTIALNPVSSTLASICKRESGVDATRLDQCETIATAMFERSDDQSLRAQGAFITFAATGDPRRRDIARAERKRMESRAEAAGATSACDAQQAEMKSLLRSAQVGEVQAMREAAHASAIP